MRKIALFTDFSPGSGGGASILRSWLPYLRDCQVAWFHFGSDAIDYPSAFSLGKLSGSKSLLSDMHSFWWLWSMHSKPELRAMIKPLLEAQPDGYWVVAHGAGVAVGNLLRAEKPNIPLHVSVHDDPECGVFLRSRRYRLLAKLSRRPMRELLTAAHGVDVISNGMQQYYDSLWSIKSEILRRYIPALVDACLKRESEDILRVGHIGTIYSQQQFCLFLQGLRQHVLANFLKPVIVLIGRQEASLDSMRACLPANAEFELLGEMQESQAVMELRKCHFVYAGYPFNRRSLVFRTTSFPTKVSTYLQAQRPIFAHTPVDSTLADAIVLFKTGIVCPYLASEAISRHIKRTIDLDLDADKCEVFRETMFGLHNVTRLERMLCKY